MDFQSTLFAPPDPGAGSVAGTLAPERTELSAGAWIDVQRNWLAGADDAFATLVSDVPWRAERRQMYDRVVTYPVSSTPTCSATRSPTRRSRRPETR